MIKIKNLRAQINNSNVLKGINLEIKKSETHVIMGPNGSGKSTLAKAIMGVNDIEITQGSIEFQDKKINDISVEEKARLGIFLANQYPIEVPGVNLANFLRIAYNTRFQDEKQKLSVLKFKQLLQKKLDLVGLDANFADRNLNEGFSGGEKKKSEILQMAVLEPKFAILDETDSGLDIDSLATIFQAVNKIKSKQPDMALLIITHYERVFKYIVPDFVHILQDGKITRSGDRTLAEKILNKGFKFLESNE